jgi:outer membrane lipoprotein-sorting protein
MKKTNLFIICVFLFISNIYSWYPAPLSSAECLLLIDSAIYSNNQIKSISCKVRHVVQATGAPAIDYQGSVEYFAPTHILIHYFSPAEEYYLSNDTSYLVYSPKAKVGVRFKKSSLKPLEKEIMNLVGHVQMNTLQSMRKEYRFGFIGYVGDSDAVLDAAPKNGWKELSKIWIKISMKKKYLTGLELYDKKGALVSQNIYFDPVRTVPFGSYFPTYSVLRSISGEGMRVDKIKYSRIETGMGELSSRFSVPIAKDADIEAPK